MFETVNGLPLHPLIVHAVVVLGPLSALGAIVYAFVPRWRSWLRWLVFLAALVVAGAAYAAKQSGLFLEPLVTQGRPAVGDLARHIMWANRLVLVIYGWLALVTVICLILPAALRNREKFPTAANVVGGILLVLGGCVLTYFVVVTGDAASHAVWGGYIQR